MIIYWEELRNNIERHVKKHFADKDEQVIQFHYIADIIEKMQGVMNEAVMDTQMFDEDTGGAKQWK